MGWGHLAFKKTSLRGWFIYGYMLKDASTVNPRRLLLPFQAKCPFIRQSKVSPFTAPSFQRSIQGVSFYHYKPNVHSSGIQNVSFCRSILNISSTVNSRCLLLSLEPKYSNEGHFVHKKRDWFPSLHIILNPRPRF